MAGEFEDNWIENNQFDVTDLSQAFTRSIQGMSRAFFEDPEPEPERREMIPGSAVLTIPKEEADKTVALYADLPELTEREKNMLAIYDAVIAGEKVIKLREVLRHGGAYEFRNSPRVVVAPVHSEMVTYRRRFAREVVDSGKFKTGRVKINEEKIEAWYQAGDWKFDLGVRAYDRYSTSVTSFSGEALTPLIPPQHRDKVEDDDLLLWEPVWVAQEEVVINPDPAIIRPLSNGLYRVVAAWDLTPVEAMMLSGE